MPNLTLYAATGNPGKLAEFATAAQPSGIQVLALPGLKSMPEPIEDAPTFLGNAELKARAYSLLAPGLLIFADDSGLETDFLSGAPGVRSARFADDQGFQLNFPAASQIRDSRNNRCLLDLLSKSANPTRTARFLCTLALARDGEILLTSSGIVPGEIIDHPRGKHGFGYDPIFLLPTLNLTMAELPREEKWNLSHRGQAFRNLLTQLPTLA